MRKNLEHLKLPQTEIEISFTDTAFFLETNAISIKKTYTAKDIEDCEHLDFASGFAPFTRGAKSTMYVEKPWTVRNSIINNSFFETNDKDIEINFDAKEQIFAFENVLKINYDSNHEDLNNQSQSKNIIVNSIADMKLILDQFSDDKLKISIPFDDLVVELTRFYVIASKEKGIPIEKSINRLQLNLLNDSNSIQKNGYTSDNLTNAIKGVFELTSPKIPEINFNSIPKFYSEKIDLPFEIELGNLLAKGFEFLQEGLKLGLKIDDFAPNISFSMVVVPNHFMEIAKMRAARMLWAKLVLSLNPKNNNSLILKTYSITKISNKDALNNITQTILGTKAAIFGGTDAIETPLVDKSNDLATRFSDELILKMHNYLKEETKISTPVDPWGGSFYIEDLTHQITQKAWEQIEKIIQLGGYTKALKSGCLNTRTEE